MTDGDDTQKEKPLTNFEAHTILIKSVLGFGTLTVPFAFICLGLVFGILFTIIFSIILPYGAYLMVKCMAEVRSKQGEASMTMSQAITIAFSEGPSCCGALSKVAGVFADVVLVLTHYGLYVVYIVFMADHLYSVYDNLYHVWNIRIIIAIIGLATLPMFLIRDFQMIYIFSLASNITIYIALTWLIVEYIVAQMLSPIPVLPMDIDYMPLFMGFIMFGISSVGLMTIVEPKMEQSEKFFGLKGTFCMSSLLVFFTNIIIAITTYIVFGDEMFVRLLFTLSGKEDATVGIIFMMNAAVYLTIPLNGYVPIDIFVKRCLSKDIEPSKLITIEYCLRVAFVLLSTILAVGLPVTMPILKLVGSFYLAFLNLIFPACMELCLMYNEANGKSKRMLAKDIFLIIMGIVVFICGLYSAIFDIRVEYAGMKILPGKWSALNDFP